ncbi:uncharacterized protein LOC142319038 [Lycorma delicatula]|uniref:uncharacterized protein LOC142319038 n=1 Tax=Lycorma delicatula TaxID=130591 RepID=UPI003F5134AB
MKVVHKLMMCQNLIVFIIYFNIVLARSIPGSQDDSAVENNTNISSNNNEAVKEEKETGQNEDSKNNKQNEGNDSIQPGQHSKKNDSAKSETTALIVYNPQPVDVPATSAHKVDWNIKGTTETAQSNIKNSSVESKTPLESNNSNIEQNGELKDNTHLITSSISDKKIDEKSTKLVEKTSKTSADSSKGINLSTNKDEDIIDNEHMLTSSQKTGEGNEPEKPLNNLNDKLKHEGSQKRIDDNNVESVDKNTLHLATDITTENKSTLHDSESDNLHDANKSKLLKKDEENELLKAFDNGEKSDFYSDMTAANPDGKYLTSDSQMHSLISNQAFIMSAVLIYISLCMGFLYIRSHRKKSYMRVPLLQNFDEANEL